MKARKQYPDELKKELTAAILSGQVQLREVSKRKKIAEGVLRRWCREFNTQQSATPVSTGTAIVPVTSDQQVQQLQAFRKPRRGGRYTAEQKSAVVKVIASGKLPMSEIQSRTGIHLTTLYAWAKEAGSGGHSRRVVVAEPLHVESRISTAQAAIHLKKAKAELLIGIRKGNIADFDNVHLNALLAFNALMGK